jgi:hypothetical protein
MPAMKKEESGKFVAQFLTNGQVFREVYLSPHMYELKSTIRPYRAFLQWHGIVIGEENNHKKLNVMKTQGPNQKNDVNANKNQNQQNTPQNKPNQQNPQKKEEKKYDSLDPENELTKTNPQNNGKNDARNPQNPQKRENENQYEEDEEEQQKRQQKPIGNKTMQSEDTTDTGEEFGE